MRYPVMYHHVGGIYQGISGRSGGRLTFLLHTSLAIRGYISLTCSRYYHAYIRAGWRGVIWMDGWMDGRLMPLLG